MTIIHFNKADKSYEIIEYDNLIEGSKNTSFVKIIFGEYVGGNFVPDTTIAPNENLQVGVIFTRSDGKHTWFIPAIPQLDGTFLSVIQGWVLRKKGVLHLDYQIRNVNNNDATPYNRVSLFVNEGTSLDDDDFVFTEADYDALWDAIGISNISIVTSQNEPLDPTANMYWYQVLEDE